MSVIVAVVLSVVIFVVISVVIFMVVSVVFSIPVSRGIFVPVPIAASILKRSDRPCSQPTAPFLRAIASTPRSPPNPPGIPKSTVRI